MSLKSLFYFLKGSKKKALDYCMYVLYSRQFKRYLKINHFANKSLEGEEAYKQKWSCFNKKVEPYSYRFFSHYLDAKENIIPENIGRSYIETKLNPESMRGFYEDKNMFSRICGEDNVPETVLCRMNGGKLWNKSFKPVDDAFVNNLDDLGNLILKPSVGSSSGRGVMLFTYRDGNYKAIESNQELSASFLRQYGEDFVLQKAVVQHNDMSVFNPSSVNTLRIAVYRSWKDERAHAYACIMRVGKNGQFVDNAHAGGMFVGVDINTGEVGNELFDQYGSSTTIWNGLDYSEKRYVPEWEKAKKFAEQTAEKLIHHRLIAMDVSIDQNGKPVLIEYNLRGFSYWLFMLTNQSPLGAFEKEIINFCQN